MTERYDVVIAGAGIAGLAALRQLHAKGFNAVALEQRAAATDAGLAINLPGNAIAALRELGLGEGLERHGQPVRRREYRTEKGRLLFAVDEQAFWGEALVPRCMRRGDLMDMLVEGLPPERIRRGVQVTDVTAHDTFVEIATSSSDTFAARLIVGADGVNSVNRKRFIDQQTPTAARLASASWRFMAPNPGVDCWTVWTGAKATVLLIPVAGDQVYCWAAAMQDRGGQADARILSELTRDFPAPVKAVVEEALAVPSALYYSPLDEVRSSRWGGPGVVLVGDAAHATAPVWAQGAALALEDVAQLSQLLASREDWADVPAQYERLRRPRVDHVQQMTDRMSRAAKLPIPVRNLLMPLLGPRSYRATYEPLKQNPMI